MTLQLMESGVSGQIILTAQRRVMEVCKPGHGPARTRLRAAEGRIVLEPTISARVATIITKAPGVHVRFCLYASYELIIRHVSSR